jgi:nicotinate-nucleotide pyrophosphorylase (carboxylating)
MGHGSVAMTVFELPAVERIVELALAEDLGRGDVTTQLSVPAGVRAHGEILAKQEGVLAGAPLVRKVYECLGGPPVTVQEVVPEGDTFLAGKVLLTLSGGAATLLTGERVALNFLQRLCGVATLTRRYVSAVQGTSARIVDTRKTSPGMRVLEKYAVRMGGGSNHRFGLDDGVLIKDNHIVAAGGIGPAVAGVKAGAPHTIKVEVECTNLTEVDQALAAGVDAILLDNMSVEQLAQAVQHIRKRVLVEASGGMTLETIRAVAETGVDLISVGALTHSARAVDLSMRMRIEG